MGFTRAELERFRGETVPDLIGDDLRLLIVGINPGLWTAATQTHFCHPSNRFYPALGRAGLVDMAIDTDEGMTALQRQEFVGRGLGITNLVQRATARARELGSEELRRGGDRLRRLVTDFEPRVVAVAGVTAFRTAFQDRKAEIGHQDMSGPSEWWVLPNPSGLNAHVTIDQLGDWFRLVGERAGVL